jgi:hypothetical protein
MDRNNRVGRRERFEILKIAQGLGEGVVAIGKGALRSLRPNTILGGAQRKQSSHSQRKQSSHSRRSYLAGFVDQFWIGRQVEQNQTSQPQPAAYHPPS